MGSKVQIIEYKGKKIVSGDYSNADEASFLEIIAEQQRASLELPDKALLHLLNFTDASMTSTARARADEMLKALQNAGYTVKTACFGITGLQRIIAGAVKRDMKFAKSEAEAKDWLVAE